MFGIGSTELLVILVVALIVLGPKSLPQIAKTIGKAMGEFRRVSTDFQRTMNLEMEQEEHDKRKKAAEKEYFSQEMTAPPEPAAAPKTAAPHTAQTVQAAPAQPAPTTEATPTVAAEDTPPPSYDATTGAQTGPDSPLARAVAKAEAEAKGVEYSGETVAGRVVPKAETPPAEGGAKA